MLISSYTTFSCALFTLRWAALGLLAPAFVCSLTFFSTPSNAQTLTFQNGRTVEAQNFPYISKRKKLIALLRRGANSSMAVARTPKFCPSYFWVAWGGNYPHNRAVTLCNASVRKMLDDYNDSFTESCKCKTVIRNMKIVDLPALEETHTYATIKLFTKNRNSGKIFSSRGVIEYKVFELVKQNSRLLNQRFLETCTGSITLSLGSNGEFDLTCFGGSTKAKSCSGCCH